MSDRALEIVDVEQSTAHSEAWSFNSGELRSMNQIRGAKGRYQHP
jgi:hypothetical protein